MRGRGFGRGMPTGRNDLFRSRPPNTSRPPSMHVDDFIKMESEGQAPTMPTGMNPPMNNRRNNDKVVLAIFLQVSYILMKISEILISSYSGPGWYRQRKGRIWPWRHCRLPGRFLKQGTILQSSCQLWTKGQWSVSASHLGRIPQLSMFNSCAYLLQQDPQLMALSTRIPCLVVPQVLVVSMPVATTHALTNGHLRPHSSVVTVAVWTGESPGFSSCVHIAWISLILQWWPPLISQPHGPAPGSWWPVRATWRQPRGQGVVLILW